MRKSKKIILFIVEGSSERTALSLSMKKFFHREDVRFCLIKGDITSDTRHNTHNIITKIEDYIKYYLKMYSLQLSDLLRVIHIVDTDGTFIPDSAIMPTVGERIYYELDRILASNREGIIQRNRFKASNINRLLEQNTLFRKVSYTVHYFSRNLDHVLYNEIDMLTDDQKTEFADEFADTHADNIDAFVEFISESSFTVKGTYSETWDFIRQNTNSLHRHSNVHLVFGLEPY